MASERTGYFWDVMEGRKPQPPAAALLGFELLAIDPEQGTIRTRFTAKPEFANPVGNVQGGFLAAMLDDTLGPALVATLPPGQFAPTIELKVNFVRPASVGALLIGTGRVVARTRSIAFLAGELHDEAGQLIATATFVRSLRTLEPLRASDAGSPRSDSHSACVNRRCVVVDLRTLPLSQCTKESECVPVGRGCCPTYSDAPEEYVGVDEDADLSILRCDPAPPCQPPLPHGDPTAFCADDGHCAVRSRERVDGVESATCFSPTQNLDHAYDVGAVGCDCAPQADQCRMDSTGRLVALFCSEQGHWQAVNDGPCGV